MRSPPAAVAPSYTKELRRAGGRGFAGQIARVPWQLAGAPAVSSRRDPRPVTVIGGSVPPYHTRPESAVRAARSVFSTAAVTRSIVAARSADMVVAGREPLLLVRVLATIRAKPPM